MRQVILDTETTGLNAATGDRIIEIGCVELINRRLSNRTFHHYINPEREVDAGAYAVHGLSREFLADKPLFAHIADELIEFLADAELIIHNAPFDLSFLESEFNRLKRPSFKAQLNKVIDTLVDARQMFPGKRNSLDALCDRFAISNQHRTLHGALLDAQLLSEVYLAMTRGQEDLTIDLIDYDSTVDATGHARALPSNLIILQASAADCQAHEAVLVEIAKERKKESVWGS
ncbi:DnaQ DNA polymerase III, epsilon subunit and related 3'-5' exonucleases [Burkholderiaceae bacterium]|jgi:DNA polymerase-3 subunit epsilon